MDRTKLSLKWLEVFQCIARSGSLREASSQLDISISTVSHHLASLEDAVGIALFDHQKRPMKLTAEGEVLLRRVDESLSLLRAGLAEVWSEDPRTLVRKLKIAAVEDLDRDVIPVLADRLRRKLPSCSISFLSRPSHEILALLQDEHADIGIASAGEFGVTNLLESPLLRDPYILVVPRVRSDDAQSYLDGAVDLPFLRYSKKQVTGSKIEAQLRRLRIDVPALLEFESTSAILSLVGDGKAWTIMTALSFAGMDGRHDRIRALRFPAAGFARQLSAFRAPELPGWIHALVDQEVRPLVQSRLIAPLVEREPWLSKEFHLLDD